MIEALAIAVSLATLWSLLLLMTIVRLRDPLGHLHYRELVFERYRLQHERLQRLASAFCAGSFLAVFLATILGLPAVLLPAAMAGAYLTIGIVRVMRSIESMRFESQEDDPCWQAFALALGWPAWSSLQSSDRTA